MMKNLSIAVEEKYVFQDAAAEAMGIDSSNLSKLINDRNPQKIRGESIQRIKKAFPEYNIEWIRETSPIKLLADFERLSKITPSPDGYGMLDEKGNRIGDPRPKETAPEPTTNNEHKGVPYYDIDFVGGFDLIFNDQTVHPSYYIDFPPFNDLDAWANMVGHSMHPLISHGDKMGLIKVEDWDSFLLEGEVYAIVTSNNFRTVKTIRKGETKDEFMMVPYNESDEFQPQSIPKSMITHVFKVRGTIKTLF